MADDDSAMTSAKMLLQVKQVEGNQEPEGNKGSEENEALEGILSLYPADFQSTTGSGATPIGSAGRAPDRNGKTHSKNLADRIRARGLEFE